jgi:hypothetical protein
MVIKMIRIEKYDIKREIEDLVKKIVPHVTPSAGLTLYDYIIEIYDMNNIVVKSASETITLSSIDDLNNFLSTIENKKILVIAYVDVGQTLILQKYNVYHIFGRYFIGILLRSKVFLYAEAIVNAITNGEGARGEIINDISGSTIIVKFANVEIYSSSNIMLIVEKARGVNLGDVTNSTVYIGYAVEVVIYNFSDMAFIRAQNLNINNSSFADIYYIESKYNFYLNYTYTDIGLGHLIQKIKVSINALSSYVHNIPIPDGILPNARVLVFVSGADNIRYSVDVNAKTITFTNNNTFNVNIDVMIEIIW